jgi:hypothetical protein
MRGSIRVPKMAAERVHESGGVEALKPRTLSKLHLSVPNIPARPLWNANVLLLSVWRANFWTG